MIEQFHFLRPWWLLALIPLMALLWSMIKHRFGSSSWRLVIDPKLLPFLLSSSEGGPRTWPRWLVGLVGLLSIMALAGPTWEKLPQPVFSTQAALVIALDLSRSMDATDIKPSRLTRARHKIADILHQRKEGQTALVVYADAAFTVTPLTDDVETILALLPSLDSDMMPAQGSRAERAFALALELFENSGVVQGDVLLVSDGTGDSETMQIEAELLRNPDFRLSVLAIGTREGGPIPITQGGFLKDATGSIVIARLQENNLRQIAKTGNGAFAALSSDDRDINTLVYAMEPRVIDQQAKLSDSNAEIWRELGPWLILLIIPLAALSFRRGVLWLMPLYVLALPPDAQALEWESLWKNQDHRAGELFEQGEFAAAAELFQNSAWKASAQYRAGEYQVALDQWQQLDSATSLYNRGNALAKLGQYEKAIAAYQQLLQSNPQHEDAIYNKKQLEDLLQNQPQKGSDPNSPNSQDDQPGSDPNSQSQAGSDPEPQGEGSDPDHQDSAKGSDPLKEQGDTKQGSDPLNGDQEQSLANLEQQMSDQAAEQWLRKIPDDPGGLLRRKFLYQYRKRGDSKTEGQNW